MLEQLKDPYSVLLTGDDYKALTEQTSGNYAGLGIQIDVRDGWITVVAPLPETPAERAGIRPATRSSRSTVSPPRAGRTIRRSRRCGEKPARKIDDHHPAGRDCGSNQVPPHPGPDPHALGAARHHVRRWRGLHLAESR